MSKRSRKKNIEREQIPVSVVEKAGAAVATADGDSKPQGRFHLAFAACVLAVCAMLYARTTDFPMQFDDVMYLQKNPLVTDGHTFSFFTDFREFIQKPLKLGIEPDLAVNIVARPVSYATFHFNQLMDGFTPRWYRVINMVIHAANAVLVYALVGLLLGRRNGSRFIAVTSALLFAVHPLAIESVTYIVQRMTSLAALFYLLTLALYFYADGVSDTRWRVSLKIGAVVCALLGMFTKECVVTLPVMAVMLDSLVRHTPWRQALRKAVPLLLCLPVVPVMVLAISWAQNGGALSLAKAVNIVNSRDVPFEHTHFILTQFTVVLEYLRLLVWPSGLNIDPHWPVYSSLGNGRVLAALALFGALLGGGGVMYWRNRTDSISTGVLAFVIWFFVTISVSSGLVPLPDLMAEHRTYLPSVGIFIVIASLLYLAHQWLQRWAWGRFAMPAFVALSVSSLAGAAWQRNEVWRTSTSLWEDTVTKSPDKFRAWGNLGGCYALEGRMEEALECCRKATQLEPRFANASLLMASVLNAQNRQQEAINEMQRLVRDNPRVEGLPDFQYNVGIAQLALGHAEEGEKRLHATINQSPSHWQTHVALGLLYRGRGNHESALKHLRTALSCCPGNKPLAAVVAEMDNKSAIAER